MRLVSKKKLLVVFCVLLVVFGLLFFYEIYVPKSFVRNPTVIYHLKKGIGSKDIANDLEAKKIINNEWFFRLYVLFSGKHSKLQAGSYEISSSMSVFEIVGKLVSGDIVKNKITIIEGWDVKDIGQYLEREKFYSKKDFESSVKSDFSNEFDFLKDKPKNLSLEGYIFPDTYIVLPKTSAEEFLKIILDNFGKKLTPDLRKKITSNNKSIFQIITMASILEKEVKTSEDKKIVSGILWKRVANHFPLQVDSTINYITGKNDSKVAIKDTKIDSLYNTYKYIGLPAGPISNPGIDSILAAAYPEKSDYWYYLSADGTGKTIFSKTLQEHALAKKKYLP